MFASVSRRLALLNVAVVVLVIALVGGATYLLLRESLEREADTALAERIDAAARAWESRLEQTAPAETEGDGEDDESEGEEGHDDGDEESHEIVESGDILLFIFNGAGQLIGNERGITVEGIPVLPAVEQALAGEDDTRVVTAGGEVLRVRTEPVEEHGEVVGVIQAARSERQHNEELRLVGIASLIGIGAGTLIALPAGLWLARRAMQPIDAAFSRQRTFVADASHELRTPLTVLRANAEMVQRLPDPSPEELRGEMAEMLVEINRRTAIVNDLLALARYGDTPGEVKLERIDVATVATRAVRSLRPQAEAASVTLETRVEGRIAAAASAALVEQVLRILVDNAVRYTVRGDTVIVSCTRHERGVETCVQDHGLGITPADLPYVFDRFYRADRARSRHTGGTGLGLPIARSLVQAMGGTISLDSAPGEGTTVCFTLPD